MGEHPAGKGDRYRPVNREKYSENWDRIFGRKDEHEDQPRTQGSDRQVGDADQEERD